MEDSNTYLNISQDESLWEKINLSGKRVPTKLLTIILNKGCKYLSLYNTKVEGDSLNFNESSKLRYLNLSLCKANEEILKDLLTSCRSLQKLSVEPRILGSEEIKKICNQNGSSLQTLHLSFEFDMDFETTRHIVNNLVELREIRFNSALSEDSLNYFVNNLTPKVTKLDIIVRTPFMVPEFADVYIRYGIVIPVV
jgi:hypothetical protein